jgi:hypothetical protein
MATERGAGGVQYRVVFIQKKYRVVYDTGCIKALHVALRFSN